MTAQRGAAKATAVFDLDAARAARREAVGEAFTFAWHGEVYTCQPAKEWSINTASALSSGDLVSAIGMILGDEQGPRFLATDPSMGDVEALMDALAEFSGVNTSGE